MDLSRPIYWLKGTKQEIEFSILLAWVMFCPGKTTFFYYFSAAFVFLVFLLKHILTEKNIAFSSFSRGLVLFNLLFLATVPFSVVRLKSILFMADILIVSAYFLVFFRNGGDLDRYHRIIAGMVSLFSAVFLFQSVLMTRCCGRVLFENPILNGIVAGLGVLLTLRFLRVRFGIPWALALGVNLAAVVASGSKAAFLGTVLFSLLLLLQKKSWILPALAVVVLTFVVPNPVARTFTVGMKKDPYVLNRLDIWQQSLRMAADHPWTGVGLDNFPEVSKRYNFPQRGGPARYFKTARRPHSDYLKVLSETGLLGLLGLLVFLVFLFRRIGSRPVARLPKIVLLYFLFQALWFNVVFLFLFFFLGLFFIRDLWRGEQTFFSMTPLFRAVAGGFLLWIFVAGYVLPLVSDTFLARAQEGGDPVSVSRWLEKAANANPLNPAVPIAQARLIYEYFTRSDDLQAFSLGLDRLEQAGRLNRHHLAPYLLKIDFYQHLLNRGLKYRALEQELLAAVRGARETAPFNPFLCLLEAEIRLEFGDAAAAEKAARRALDLEPDYVGALYFLHRHFGHIAEESEFQRNIGSIRAKAEAYEPPPGSYLHNLFEIPASATDR